MKEQVSTWAERWRWWCKVKKQKNKTKRGMRYCKAAPLLSPPLMRWWKWTTAGMFHEWRVWFTSSPVLHLAAWPVLKCAHCGSVFELALVCVTGPLGTDLARRCCLDNKLLWWSGVNSPLSAATKPTWRRRGGLRWVEKTAKLFSYLLLTTLEIIYTVVSAGGPYMKLFVWIFFILEVLHDRLKEYLFFLPSHTSLIERYAT